MCLDFLHLRPSKTDETLPPITVNKGKVTYYAMSRLSSDTVLSGNNNNSDREFDRALHRHVHFRPRYTYRVMYTRK